MCYCYQAIADSTWVSIVSFSFLFFKRHFVFCILVLVNIYMSVHSLSSAGEVRFSLHFVHF